MRTGWPRLGILVAFDARRLLSRIARNWNLGRRKLATSIASAGRMTRCRCVNTYPVPSFTEPNSLTQAATSLS